VISKQFQEIVLEVLNRICKNLKPIIEWVINTIKNIINVFTWLNNISPYLNLGLIILRYWVYNYTQMLSKLEQFNIIG
jgi:hypothetical protein